MNNYQDHVLELSTLPYNYTPQMALENGDIVKIGVMPYNLNRLQQFLMSIENRTPDKIRITMFGIDGYPSISILEYNGKDIIFTNRYFIKEDVNYISYYGNRILVRPRNDSNIIDYMLLTYDNREIYVFYYAPIPQ